MVAVRVAVFYTHPLLGRGIARLLEREPELDVVCRRVEPADVPAVASTLGVDAVVMEDWEDQALIEQVIQALPPVPVVVVRLQDNTTYAYQDRRRFYPREDNVLEFTRAFFGRPHASTLRRYPGLQEPRGRVC